MGTDPTGIDQNTRIRIQIQVSTLYLYLYPLLYLYLFGALGWGGHPPGGGQAKTCFGPKWPKTGHFGCRTSCVAGGRVGLPSAVSPCAGTLWWRSIFAQFHFFSFFGFLWPNPMFFFSMAFFRFCRTSQTCHVVIQSPKPQPSCPPTVAQCGGAAFWLVLPFLCLGKVCRGRKAGHKGKNCCGMCKVQYLYSDTDTF